MCAWPSLTFNIYQYDVSTCRLSFSLRTSNTSSFKLSLLSRGCVILPSPTCCSIISRYRVIPRLRTPEVEVVLKTNAGEIGRGGPDAEMDAGTGHIELGTSLNGWWAEHTYKQMYEQRNKWYIDSDMVEDAKKWPRSLLNKCARDLHTKNLSQPGPGEPGKKFGKSRTTKSRKFGFPSAFPIPSSWKAWLPCPLDWWINLPSLCSKIVQEERGKTVYYNDCAMDSCSRLSVRRDWCTVAVLFTVYFCQKVSCFKLRIW